MIRFYFIFFGIHEWTLLRPSTTKTTYNIETVLDSNCLEKKDQNNRAFSHQTCRDLSWREKCRCYWLLLSIIYSCAVSHLPLSVLSVGLCNDLSIYLSTYPLLLEYLVISWQKTPWQEFQHSLISTWLHKWWEVGRKSS